EAIAWIEQRFRALGLTPAGDDGYRQRIEVPTGVTARHLLLAVDGKLVEGLVAAGFSASGRVEAPIVYAGYGIVAPELGQDDYRGRVVKGRIVLVRRFAPDPFDTAAHRTPRALPRTAPTPPHRA